MGSFLPLLLLQVAVLLASGWAPVLVLLHHHPSSSTTPDSPVLPPALTSMRLSMDIPNPHGFHRVQCQNLEWFWFSELYGLGIDCPKAKGTKESEVAQKSCGCTIPAVLKARLDAALGKLIY